MTDLSLPYPALFDSMAIYKTLKTIPKVRITDAMRREARRLENKVMKNFGYDDSTNYVQLGQQDRYYLGYMGELAFYEYCQAVGLAGKYDISTDGTPDAGDFFFTQTDGIGITLDTKTAAKEFHMRMMVPQAQHDRFSYDIYVGLKLIDGYAEIHGWCKATEFELSEEGFNTERVPTLYRMLEDLHGIEDLEAELMHGDMLKMTDDG